MKIIDPKKQKHKVNRLIKEGKFQNIKVNDHEQLMRTFHGLQMKNPNAFFELSEFYLIYFDGNKLTAYSI